MATDTPDTLGDALPREMSDDEVQLWADCGGDPEVIAMARELLAARTEIAELKRQLAMPICKWCFARHAERNAPGGGQAVCKPCFQRNWEGDGGSPPETPYEQLEVWKP